MIPGEIFTGFAKFKAIVSVSDLVSLSAPGASAGSSGFPEKFLFCTSMIVSTVFPSLVPPQRIDDCFEIHNFH